MTEQGFFGVTLGVADMSSATAFYNRLGWPKGQSTSPAPATCFTLGPINITLLPRDTLIEAAGLLSFFDMDSICPCMTINIPVATPADVEAYLQNARSAGATVLKPAQNQSDGSCSGYFMDPDGHIFEIAYTSPHLGPNRE